MEEQVTSTGQVGEELPSLCLELELKIKLHIDISLSGSANHVKPSSFTSFAGSSKFAA